MPESTLPKHKRFDPFIFIMTLPLSIIFIILQALFFAIIVDWLALSWKPKTYPSVNLLSIEVSSLEQRLQGMHNPTTQRYSAYTLSERLYRKAKAWTDTIKPFVSTIHNPISQLQPWIHGIEKLYPYWWSINESVERCIWRICLYIGALPWILLLILVAVTDGLIQRQRRRWGGGRESSHHFELASRTIRPTLNASFIVFVSLPVTITPSVVLMPFALVLSFAFWQSCATFKKYF